jgi:hypothetical protein
MQLIGQPSNSQGALGNGLPSGFNDNHFQQPDANGNRLFNQSGIDMAKSQIPTQPTIAQQMMNSYQPYQMQPMDNGVQPPPPMSPQQAAGLANMIGMTGVGSALSGVAGGAAAAGSTSGLLSGLLALI